MKNRILLLSALTIVAAASCKHEPFRAVGGKGGSATLVVYPQHHGESLQLDSMKVYIKYDAVDAPANGIYDDSASCPDSITVPFCSFAGLNNGNYYIFSKGWDGNISNKVKGGIKYTITAQQSQNVLLPVSED